MKLKLKEKLLYATGDLSGNIMIAGMSFYLLFFMVKIGHVDPALAGLIILLSKLWDAITDYWMGRISDKTKCKFGKRRIYMLISSLPSVACFALLFVLPPSSASMGAKFAYFLFINCLYNTAWTIFYVPYNSLTANMTDDYNERTSLNSFRIAFANIGILLGAALFSLFSQGEDSVFYPLVGEKYSYLCGAAVLAAVSGLLLLLCTFGVKERVSTSADNSYSFFQTLKQFFKMKEFRNTTTYYLFSMIGFDVIMAVYMFFITDSLDFGGGAIGMAFVAVPLVAAICAAPLWDKISARLDKIKAYIIGVCIATFFLIFTAVIPEYTKSAVGSIVGLVLVSGLAGVGLSAIQIMPWASLPDVVEADEYYNKVRREGAFYGLMSFMYKFASGLAVFAVGAVLGIFGYDETLDAGAQPEPARMAIRVVLAALPGVIFLLSIIFARRTEINKARYLEITDELKRRKLERDKNAETADIDTADAPSENL